MVDIDNNENTDSSSEEEIDNNEDTDSEEDMDMDSDEKLWDEYRKDATANKFESYMLSLQKKSKIRDYDKKHTDHMFTVLRKGLKTLRGADKNRILGFFDIFIDILAGVRRFFPLKLVFKKTKK